MSKTSLGALASATLTVLFLAGSARQAESQVIYSTIVGEVLDSTGGIVNQAAVTLTSADRNQVRTTTTKDTGAFAFSNVMPGVYQLKIKARGFQD
jgi:hypothetical protein